MTTNNLFDKVKRDILDGNADYISDSLIHGSIAIKLVDTYKDGARVEILIVDSKSCKPLIRQGPYWLAVGGFIAVEGSKVEVPIAIIGEISDSMVLVEPKRGILATIREFFRF